MPCNSDAAAAAGIPRSAARVPPHGRKRSKHPKTIRTMNYVELNIAASGEEAEILTALLADWPFESFSEEGGALRALDMEAFQKHSYEKAEAYLAKEVEKKWKNLLC